MCCCLSCPDDSFLADVCPSQCLHQLEGKNDALGLEDIQVDCPEQSNSCEAAKLLAPHQTIEGREKNVKKVFAALLLLVCALQTQAGYIDNRSAPGSGEVDAFYKAMPVEDVVLGLVPGSYRVVYENEEIAKKTVTVSGKGAWDAVFTKGLKEAQLLVTVDEKDRVVRVSRAEAAKKVDPEKGAAGNKSGSVAAPPAAPAQACVLTAGQLVGDELQKCGLKTGWKLIWNLKRDFTVPQTTTYPGDFPTAAGDAVKTLASNGALIRASIYEGNKTVVVTGPGVAPQ